MRKVKVAEVITRLDWGGSPDIVRIICSHLDKQIYDVWLIYGLTRKPSLKTVEFLENFKDKVIFIPQLRRNPNPILDLLALIRLYLLFRRMKFDIIHTHTAKAGALGRVAAYLLGEPAIIYTPHGHNFYGYFGNFLSKIIVITEKILSFLTDRIMVFTKLEKSDFINFKVAVAERISVIYQGLELENYTHSIADKDKIKRKFNIKPDENVIGMVGRLEPIKGVEYFLDMAGQMEEKFENTKFIVAGEGNLRKKLEKKAEALGLGSKFIFTGWAEDIQEIFSILDILVLPSLNEAVGMVLIEAQSMGVPVVATRVGGIPEVVRDGETGILVSPRSPASLAQAINYLLADRQKRQYMAQAGRAWVKDKFKIQDMIDGVSSLYQELILSKK